MDHQEYGLILLENVMVSYVKYHQARSDDIAARNENIKKN